MFIKKKCNQAIKVIDLKETVLKEGLIPIPNTKNMKEYSYAVHPRGMIFLKSKKKRKPIKF